MGTLNALKGSLWLLVLAVGFLFSLGCYESLSSNIGLPNLPLPSVTSVASVITESHSPPSGDYRGSSQHPRLNKSPTASTSNHSRPFSAFKVPTVAMGRVSPLRQRLQQERRAKNLEKIHLTFKTRTASQFDKPEREESPQALVQRVISVDYGGASVTSTKPEQS